MRAPLLLTVLLAGLATAQDAGTPTPAQAEAQVEVEVQGLKSSQGKVWALLFDAPKAFPTRLTEAKQSLTVDIVDQKATVVFRGVPPGVYAVAVIHDENGNGKVDTNWIGIPIEGLASSRNAKGFMGPPKFDDAKVTVGTQGLKLQVTVRY